MAVEDARKLSEAKDMSSGLLINVIRAITTSASNDQKELAKERLEAGFHKSGKWIDQLLTEQEGNVQQSVEAFRDVAKNIRECRERINRVQNALSASRGLIQSRRDELKKLWCENLEQKKVAQVLDQINEVKNVDRLVQSLAQQRQFGEAVDRLKKADILLNGPLSGIDGLCQLRASIGDVSQQLLNTITECLVDWLLVDTFDRQLLDLVRKLPEAAVSESPVCTRLVDKYFPGLQASPLQLQTQIGVELARERRPALQAQLADALQALTVFDQLDTALEQLAARTPAVCRQVAADTVHLLRALHASDGSDSSHLVQFITLLIAEMKAAFAAVKLLAEEAGRLRNSEETRREVVWSFWDAVQSMLETVVSDHVDIYPLRERGGAQHLAKTQSKSLFRFANTAAVSAGSGGASAQQPFVLVCPADPYNIIPIFHPLDRFCAEIARTLGLDVKEGSCKLNTFLNSFVMDIFIERIRQDMDSKIDHALSGAEVWQTLASVHGSRTKILVSCKRVFDLCTQIGEFIRKMDKYTQRFALIWVAIMEEYTKVATEMYSKITHSRTVQGDQMTEHSKTSANWAVDEDISRLLKSLPSWQVVAQQTPVTGEMTPSGLLHLNESEEDIRRRTQRESEIMISNLGSLPKIDSHAVITDLAHVKAIACMHESLQWFSQGMRQLIANIPKGARDAMDFWVRITSPEGESVQRPLKEALESRLHSVEQMAETCLLMMHLELRVHCFYHLLPLARSGSVGHHEDSEREVVEFSRDMVQLHQLLAQHIAPNKLKYLFDGLGHLCAAIFIHSSQYIQKLTENSRKRVCRNIFAVQKCLSKVTGRPETELNRAQTFFELLSKDPDQLLAHIMERGASFSDMEYRFLVSLAIRSHPLLSSQPGVLDLKLTQLNEILAKLRN